MLLCSSPAKYMMHIALLACLHPHKQDERDIDNHDFISLICTKTTIIYTNLGILEAVAAGFSSLLPSSDFGKIILFLLNCVCKNIWFVLFTISFCGTIKILELRQPPLNTLFVIGSLFFFFSYVWHGSCVVNESHMNVNVCECVRRS